MTLKSRLISLVLSLSVTIILVISAYFIHRQAPEIEAAGREKSALMKDDLRTKGMALARTVAQASERAINVLDFLFPAEVVTNTVRNDKEIVYGIIMDKERRALVHTAEGKTGQILDGPEDHFAAEQNEVATQELGSGDQRVLEVMAPIVVADSRWGTMRFGVSLASLNAELARSERRLAEQIRNAILATIAAALALAVLAIAAGYYAAGRLAAPLDQLMVGVDRLRQGDLAHQVEVTGVDEFVKLGRAFNQMTQSVKERDEALRQNMSELQHALEAAQEAARLKSEFVANISHELRTPLNAIINVPTSLLKQYETVALWHCDKCGKDFRTQNASVGGDEVAHCPTDDQPMKLETRVVCTGELSKHQYFLRRLEQQGKHLLSVVNDLLDFSKLEAGKMQLYAAEVEISAMLNDAVDTVSGLARDKGVHLAIEQGEGAHMISADPVKMAQILINLIGNAVKFTPENGRITVSAEQYQYEGPAVLFTVADSGIGIPEDQLEAIFESFRQVDGSHTRAHGGTGLGLAITRKLVELHGGKIWAESSVGKGTRLRFFVPVAPQPQHKDADQTTPSAEQRRHVIVVDDNQVQLEITRMILERAGFTAEAVSDPRQAIERMRTEKPAFVVLDIMMPNVSGLSILKELRADNTLKDLPVLVSTAYHSNRDIVVALGAIWLPKPWHASNLIETLREHHLIEERAAVETVSGS